MTQSEGHPEKLRVQVIGLFFTGLLLMAILAVGVGWACRFAPLSRAAQLQSN